MGEKIYTDEQGQYLKNNPTWHMEDSPWKAKQILKILSGNSLHPKSIAEVGCGAGEILNQLHGALPDDVRYTGYDISHDAIEFARQRTKDRLDFKKENFVETPARYDLLLMIDVFEHVDDYMGFLRLCKGKSTYTIFHIPLDVSAQGILRNKLIAARKSVGHVHYFTKETALATVADCGYEVVDYFYTAGAVELPKHTLKAKLAFLPRKMLYKISKDFAAKILGGYSLLVLAKSA